ncbi:hypothetical protein ABS71_06045 [bacterium SCN 62-11]|nr:MAG: hypothetical protein ABS71_06045 [bacterium SCN 62-11]
MNKLLALYHRLDGNALNCLEMACRYPGQVLILSEEHLRRLHEMELLEFRHSQGWRPNWLGAGVLNWHRQLREAQNRHLVASLPRPGENGSHLGPTCDEFRPLLFSGVYCWCGRLRSEHLDEAPETALRFLRYYQRTRSPNDPQHRISGRSFPDLVHQLPSDLGEVLELIPPGATMHQLFQLLGGRVRFLAIQESLCLLLDLDLAYPSSDDPLWRLSWDGLGVNNWLKESTMREILDQPMTEAHPGENGESLLPVPCKRYRPLLSKQARPCWCGHSRTAHERKRPEPGLDRESL